MAQKNIESTILNKLFKVQNVLSKDGVGYTDYITQITYLLFLKMDYELTLEEFSSSIDEKYNWQSLKDYKGNDLIEHYEAILEDLSKKSGLLGAIFTKAHNKINKPANLLTIIGMLDEDNWFDLDYDIKGTIYEGILEKNGQDTKSAAGQYFTPRPLIEAMVDVTRPKIGEVVCDPACGTGGFLLAAHQYMRKQANNDRKKLEFLDSRGIVGYDITPLVVTLGSMNLYLHGIDDKCTPITERDTLEKEPDFLVDVVLANPPFGARPQGSSDVSAMRQDFYATTSNNQLNFLQHIMIMLKQGKLKKEKSLPPIKEDEVPYELPKSWKWVRLGDICYNISTRPYQINTSAVKKQGLYKVISQGENFIEGYSDEANKLFKIQSPLVLFGDHTRNVKYITFDFIIGADGTKLLCPYSIHSKFFYYLIEYASQTISNKGYARHFSLLSQFIYPLPPLAEQERIVAKIEEIKEIIDEIG